MCIYAYMHMCMKLLQFTSTNYFSLFIFHYFLCFVYSQIFCLGVKDLFVLMAVDHGRGVSRQILMIHKSDL